MVCKTHTHKHKTWVCMTTQHSKMRCTTCMQPLTNTDLDFPQKPVIRRWLSTQDQKYVRQNQRQIMVNHATSKKYITILQIHTNTCLMRWRIKRAAVLDLFIFTNFCVFRILAYSYKDDVVGADSQCDDQATEWATGQSGFDSRQQNTRVHLSHP